MKKIISLTLISAMVLGINAYASNDYNITQFSLDGMTTDVILANDSMHSDENASTMIESDVKYAINGGFFNSYYNTAQEITFPDNSPRIYGAIVQDGHIVNAGSVNNMIGFTYDNKVLVDRVTAQPSFVLNSSYNVNLWAVNQVYTDTMAITIMTDEFNMPFSTLSSAVIFTVKDEKIIEQTNGGSMQTVADGTYKIVYNSLRGVTPQIGDTVQFASSFSSQGNDDWSDVKTAVTGGRILVIDGKNVSGDSSYNSQFDSDPKQAQNSVAMRSFAGVKADGTVVFGTGSSDFSQVSEYLIGIGVTQAISLDGGASSMLYSGGFQMNAGRELASILVVKPSDGTEVKPDEPDVFIPAPTVSGGNTPSSWAVDATSRGSALGIIPSWMQSYYQTPITREEFCVLITKFIEVKTGQSIDSYRGSLGISYDDFTFTDTDNYFVRSVAALGIVNGTGDGEFSPKDGLTREQSATMLKRMVDLMGEIEKNSEPNFNDESTISDWAKDAVSFITAGKVMNGTGENFEPKGTYTREQAFVTMMNMYDALEIK